jgi:hypothetical protein
MTNEQINMAIAEACGWSFDCDLGVCWDQYGNAIITPPNYCADLNAMHEAEKVLSVEEIAKYVWTLSDPRKKTLPFMATSYQRAEAFLRTLGKWEEAK